MADIAFMWSCKWGIWKISAQVQWHRCSVAISLLYAYESGWSMDSIWNVNTTKMPPSPYTVKSVLPICQGKPFEFSRPNRLWHSLIIQWIWQEVMLENLSETTEFNQFYWTQWWAGSNWAVCRLYGVPTQTDVNQARPHLFVKGRKELDMLSPTRDALDRHCKRVNYQACIWLQADQEQIIVPPPTDTFAWTKETSMLSPVWTRQPPIPEACLQLVTCGCKSKCKTVRCTCYKKGLRCTPACGCDAVECCNPARQ